MLAQPPKPVDRAHRVRLAVGNGLRPEIWDEFQTRFGIDRIVEFYSASESNIGFANVFGQRNTVGFSPQLRAIVEVDVATGEPIRDARGRCRRVQRGRPGLLLGQEVLGPALAEKLRGVDQQDLAGVGPGDRPNRVGQVLADAGRLLGDGGPA